MKSKTDCILDAPSLCFIFHFDRHNGKLSRSYFLLPRIAYTYVLELNLMNFNMKLCFFYFYFIASRKSWQRRPAHCIAVKEKEQKRQHKIQIDQQFYYR